MTESEWLASEDADAMLRHMTRGNGSLRQAGGQGWRASERKVRLFACACARLACDLATWPWLRDAVGYAEDYADGLADQIESGRWEVDRLRKRGDFPAGERAALWLVSLCCTRPQASAFSLDWPSQIGTTAKTLLGNHAADVAREVFGNPLRPVGGFVRAGSGLIMKRDPYRLELAPPGETPHATVLEVDGDTMKVRPAHDPVAVGVWMTPRPPWLTPTVLSLARAAYDERGPQGLLEPDRLAILADAVEEAGCTEEPLLRHLRGQSRVMQVPQGTCKGKGFLGAAAPGQHGWIGAPICTTCNAHGKLSHLEEPGPHVRGCWAVDLVLGKD